MGVWNNIIIMSIEKPKFYLKIYNGGSMCFGIKVFLNNDREHMLFAEYTHPTYETEKTYLNNL